jgi:AcrR family transcriptional regulator
MTIADTAVRRRPGGRTARVRSAVLRAFLQELAEAGFSATSFESVAVRAGVHKTTVYRRWRSRESLLIEAAREYSADGVPLPDTGSLRGDLYLLAQQASSALRSPGPQALLRAVVTEANLSPELSDVARSYWLERLGHVAEIVRRGIERGEVAISIDPTLVIETLIGPMYLRALVTQQPVDDSFIEGLVDLVLAAATGEPQ